MRMLRWKSQKNMRQILTMRCQSLLSLIDSSVFTKAETLHVSASVILLPHDNKEDQKKFNLHKQCKLSLEKDHNADGAVSGVSHLSHPSSASLTRSCTPQRRPTLLQTSSHDMTCISFNIFIFAHCIYRFEID